MNQFGEDNACWMICYHTGYFLGFSCSFKNLDMFMVDFVTKYFKLNLGDFVTKYFKLNLGLTSVAEEVKFGP